MTAETIPSFPRSLLGRPHFDHMPDTTDQHWRYCSDMPMFPVAQWTSAQQPPVYQPDAHQYSQSYVAAQQPTVSPSLYSENWSDTGMEMTPSPGDFSGETMEFQHAHSSQSGHLHPPERMHRGVGSTVSVRSSNSSMQNTQTGRSEDRPPLPRSVTAPEHVNRAGKVPNKTSPGAKRVGNSDEDDDDEYVPAEQQATRGRKRQRIPHTAVERRYRENLNAHLDRLRQAVPALAARKGPDGGEGVKPSKCEVLNGAIEHIGALDRENGQLKNQVRTLQARVAELEHWYARGGSH